MNSALIKLLKKHELSEKDCYEINQIYCILSDEKKQAILDNFEVLALKIKEIESQLITEQNILLDSIIPEIQKIIQK